MKFWCFIKLWSITLHQKKKFSSSDFFSKRDQCHGFLRIWSNVLNKSLMEHFTFWAVSFDDVARYLTRLTPIFLFYFFFIFFLFFSFLFLFFVPSNIGKPVVLLSLLLLLLLFLLLLLLLLLLSIFYFKLVR